MTLASRAKAIRKGSGGIIVKCPNKGIQVIDEQQTMQLPSLDYANLSIKAPMLSQQVPESAAAESAYSG
jgi:hypothetical protein